MAVLGLSSHAIASIASQLAGREIADDATDYESDVSLEANHSGKEIDGDLEEEKVDRDSEREELSDVNLNDDRICRHKEAPGLPKLVEDDAHHNKKAWQDIYVAEGTKRLAGEMIKAKIKEKLQDKRILAGKDEAWTANAMDQCFLSTDKRITESVLYGNLALDRRSDRRLQVTLEETALQSRLQAGIYYQQFVDLDSRSPSVTHLLKMADIMEAYIKRY
ncbi:hypothetical protein OPT61_g3759 [Boeremia exigua]|uniref:Uncharacterized protein n=1 Tax=Boeremia exigua TaxID=749465 RepID=A0ACC2IGQ9_9PLEO|nr:hypothetical protein OPT61_g3759 [Boeremia exigua]